MSSYQSRTLRTPERAQLAEQAFLTYAETQGWPDVDTYGSIGHWVTRATLLADIAEANGAQFERPDMLSERCDVIVPTLTAEVVTDDDTDFLRGLYRRWSLPDAQRPIGVLPLAQPHRDRVYELGFGALWPESTVPLPDQWPCEPNRMFILGVEPESRQAFWFPFSRETLAPRQASGALRDIMDATARTYERTLSHPQVIRFLHPSLIKRLREEHDASRRQSHRHETYPLTDILGG